MDNSPSLSKVRLYLGGAILIIGFTAPVFIPLITNSNLSIGLKSTISGLLAFGIPEVFMLIAVGILGKDGYAFFKTKLGSFISRIAPDEISIIRHRIGVLLFCLPLILGFLQPYIGHYIDFFNSMPLWYTILSDVIFMMSVFILGGSFWDKLRGLFKYSKN